MLIAPKNVKDTVDTDFKFDKQVPWVEKLLRGHMSGLSEGTWGVVMVTRPLSPYH